ncbi:Deoxyhypusine synthase-domain-containing protein [Tuber indicum]|nr:Deoxyhypusine synthase-domain-containing protein [Tuber indicum]
MSTPPAPAPLTGGTSTETFTAFPPIPSPSPSTTTSPPASLTNPTEDDRPILANDAVLKPSDPIPSAWNSRVVSGPEFNALHHAPITVSSLIDSMANIGFQGSELARAVEVIDGMRTYVSSEGRRATIFLGYTSNLISSGLRSTLRYLVEHKHVSAIVTTAGGIEEDLIKCLAPTYLGAFSLPGGDLRAKGLNRIGNLLVPNNNYCLFEDWIIPIFDKMLEEQEASNGELIWTPSKIIHRLGKEINHPESVCYWAYRNDIPVFCPALTDGSIGDMLFFHTYRSSPKQLVCDIVGDIRKINSMSLRAEKLGAIILGGGIVKHHIANACLMRNGAHWAVFVNTASEFDGSDAGARPDEAVSWGKIRADGESAKVYAEATIVFPLIVAATFAKDGITERQEERR